MSARAEVRAEPDMAVFTAGVETRGETVEEAREANVRAMPAVRERLPAMGADERDPETRNLQISAEWHYNPNDGTRTLIGFMVSHSLEVTATNLDMLGQWMDAAVQAGTD